MSAARPMESPQLIRQVVAARCAGRSCDEIAGLLVRRGLVQQLRAVKLGTRDWRRGMVHRVLLAVAARTIGGSPADMARIGVRVKWPAQAVNL